MRHGENIYQVVEDDKVIFEGTTEQVAKKLWLSETYVLRTARTNGRLLHEWIAKVVEN